MRSPETCKFIAARVIQFWVTDREPILPLLGEDVLTTGEGLCPKGHAELVPGTRRCRACDRDRKRARYQRTALHTDGPRIAGAEGRGY